MSADKPYSLFDADYCAVCYHNNHPGYECVEPIPKELFEPGTVPPYLATCNCRWPTSEAERGEIIVTMGSCDVCGHRNHTGYGNCWFFDVTVNDNRSLNEIPCECVQ